MFKLTCAEKEIFVHDCLGCKSVQPLKKTLWRFLKHVKLRLSYDPVITTWSYTDYLKKEIKNM